MVNLGMGTAAMTVAVPDPDETRRDGRAGPMKEKP
jgi:hypothetical protein